MVNLEIGDRRGREVLLQRLPVLPLIERHVGAFERSRVQQPFLLRVLANHVHRLIVGNAVRTGREQRPVLAIIVRHVQIRLEIVQIHAVDRDIRGAPAMG